ncbi:tetratricopeptide repeat protein [Paracoccus albicereus]|uniref:tetratricopeptide repeat protein n=1 Tax=Paracoccus albicereus TaxID=2922394 RepID=UPI0021011E8F|nr:tetratricopeptide repeat protein [Paracoccus albicereus]
MALLSAPAFAQDGPTLADLQADLRTLSADLQSLRGELMASGQLGYAAAGGDTAIDRMNAMEAQIATLTGQAEQLQNRIRRVVADGTTRLGDIEFRLCEMDPNCDLSSLMNQPELGSTGNSGMPAMPAPASGAAGAPPRPAATTASEQADFDRAREVLGQGDFRRAAELFAAVAETHAGGPLTAQALYLRGIALERAGDQDGAAGAWLESFAADPEGSSAADSLLRLATVIGEKGDPLAACLYLAEIPVRFGGSDAAVEAESRMAQLNCGAAALPVPDGVEGLDPEFGADMAEHG